MPYKQSGEWVLVKKGGRWVRLKHHDSPGQAAAHARALNANVTHKKRRAK